MKPNISDIEDGIEFISADPSGDSEAFLSLATGKIHYRSEYVDEALPSDIDDDSKYLALPCKRNLNLNVVLIFRFVEQRLPDKASEVRMFFKKRGAYARYSNWLDRHNLTDDWYRFREQATTEAIVKWCKNNHVDL